MFWRCFRVVPKSKILVQKKYKKMCRL